MTAQRGGVPDRPYCGLPVTSVLSEDENEERRMIMIHRDCEYLRVNTIPVEEYGSGRDLSTTLDSYICTYLGGRINITSKECDTNNDFCPYNPKRQRE